MKKIIISLSIMAMVAGIVIGATGAFFSDTETSTGNTFSSGTMDFRIARPGETSHRIFDVSNLKPGQVIEGYLAVVNDSTDDLDMKWKAWIPDFSNGILDNVLEFRVTMNPAGYDYVTFTDAGYTIAGPGYNSTTHTGSGTPSSDWMPITVLGNDTILAWNYDCCDPGSCDGGNEPFRVDWAGIYKIEVRMQTTAGNAYQNQSFTGDLNFYATQCEDTL